MYREKRERVSGVPLFFEKSPLSLYFTYRNNIVTCRTATAAPNAISVLNTILNTGQPHEPVSCRIAATVTRQGAYSSTNTSRAKAVAGVQRPSLRICFASGVGSSGSMSPRNRPPTRCPYASQTRRDGSTVPAPCRGGLQTSVEVPAPRARRARP